MRAAAPRAAPPLVPRRPDRLAHARSPQLAPTGQVGRAHFEMVQYTEALRAFEQAQAIEPHRLCGMEVHSTILWHLKREVALCYLAKRALDFERTSAYACCVVGNCFSLQKEHDTALKFFQRAIQLQPDLAYASRGPRMDLAWTSRGPRMDLAWTSHGSRMDVAWTSHGPGVRLAWTRTRAARTPLLPLDAHSHAPGLAQLRRPALVSTSPSCALPPPVQLRVHALRPRVLGERRLRKGHGLLPLGDPD